MDIQRPENHFPGGEPSAELQITDIWGGAGGEAKPGDTVKVHYVGVAYSTGEEFDASWNRGEPLEFKLGTGKVIAGWDQGVQGMKVGGRRQLIIPPALAYGDRGAGHGIAPGETLIFVCDEPVFSGQYRVIDVGVEGQDDRGAPVAADGADGVVAGVVALL